MTAVQQIGIGSLQAFPLPELSAAHDKEDRGAVLVVAGGAAVPGAGLLTGEAVLRAGAGKLQLVTTRASALALGMAMPEAAVRGVATTPAGEISPTCARSLARPVGEADAVVIGPGMMDPNGAAKLALALIAAAKGAGFVLDAAALTGLDLKTTATHSLKGRLVLTPHAGEMAKLTGRTKDAILQDPIGAARTASAALRGVVIMKGAVSFIAAPDGRLWRHDGGAIGLATSGSGDVLAGVIGGLMARGAPAATAALWGVCLHAEAGQSLTKRCGAVGFLARDLLAEIPAILNAASAVTSR
jgi:ADP-dependent NAD(P)H-hydrate dehydratase